MSCDECEDTYERASTRFAFEKKPVRRVHPPCSTCRPVPMSEVFPVLVLWDRCGDEWMTGAEGSLVAIAGPSIESAMNVGGIDDPEDRREIYDAVKVMSRVIAREVGKERARRMEETLAERNNADT